MNAGAIQSIHNPIRDLSSTRASKTPSKISSKLSSSRKSASKHSSRKSEISAQLNLEMLAEQEELERVKLEASHKAEKAKQSLFETTP